MRVSVISEATLSLVLQNPIKQSALVMVFVPSGHLEVLLSTEAADSCFHPHRCHFCAVKAVLAFRSCASTSPSLWAAGGSNELPRVVSELMETLHPPPPTALTVPSLNWCKKKKESRMRRNTAHFKRGKEESKAYVFFIRTEFLHKQRLHPGEHSSLCVSSHTCYFMLMLSGVHVSPKSSLWIFLILRL